MKFIKHVLIFITILTLSFGAIAQKTEPVTQPLEALKFTNFPAYCKAKKEVLWADYEAANTRAEKKSARKAISQHGRWEYLWKNYTNADGSLNKKMYEIEALNLQPNTSISNNSASARGVEQWTQVGPKSFVNPHGYVAYPGMGRINVVRSLGNNTYIAGAPNGGVWKTTNNGANWTPKTDKIARLGITDIRVNPNSPNTIYALTGDRDATNCASIGVLRSNDAGETWQTTGKVLSPVIDDFSNTTLGINPNAPDKLIFSANGMVYYSVDGGTNFATSQTSIEKANDILYTNDFILISTTKGKIYKSTNGGESFEKIFEDQLGATEDFCLRLNQKIINGNVYILAGIKDAGAIYKASNADILAANSNSLLSLSAVGAAISDYSPQGTYDVVLEVNPNNDKNIYVAGVDGYYTSDAAGTWTKALDAYDSDKSGQLYVHPDHHFAEYVDANTLLITHDGGVSLINTTKLPFTQNDITGDLVISQIYHTGIFPPDANNDNFMMGLQDNDGFSKSPNTLNGQWVAVSAGDGTAAAINQNNPLIRFIGGTEGALDRTTTAFKEDYKDKKNVIKGNKKAPFVCEALIHNENPDYVFAGHVEAKFSTDAGVTFNEVPKEMQTGPTEEIEQYGNRVAIVGANAQKIAAYKDGVFSDVAVLEKPIGVDVQFNSISLSTTNNTVVYATIKGYDAGKKVFKSSDNGATWTNISFNLPNLIVKKIVSQATNLGIFDEILYVATNTGVYAKYGSTSNDWKKLGDNLPFTEINDLDINYVSGKLYASTYGRGIWEYPVSAPVVATKNVESPLSNITISPNPIQNGQTLTVKIPSEIGAAKCTIYNYVGGRMAEFNVNATEKTLILPTLTVGTYLAVFESKGQQKALKIVIIQ